MEGCNIQGPSWSSDQFSLIMSLDLAFRQEQYMQVVKYCTPYTLF